MISLRRRLIHIERTAERVAALAWSAMHANIGNPITAVGRRRSP
jgi:hypothetical protein